MAPLNQSLDPVGPMSALSGPRGHLLRPEPTIEGF